MLDLPPVWTRQKVEQVKAYFSAVENPHNPPHEAMKDTRGCRLGWGNLEWVKQRTQYCKYGSWQSSSKPRSGKGTQTDSGISMRHSCQKTWERTVKNGKQAKWSQRSSFLLKNKQQTTRPHSVHWWLSHQRPDRVWLHCQAMCDCHPWRQCSLYSLNLQFDKGGGSSHSCLPLDCLKMWQSDHTCHHPNRFNELATKSEKWNGTPRLVCVNGQQPPMKTPVGVLPWTSWSDEKWLSR